MFVVIDVAHRSEYPALSFIHRMELDYIEIWSSTNIMGFLFDLQQDRKCDVLGLEVSNLPTYFCDICLIYV